MNILFRYIPEGNDITTDNGDKKIMAIRKGPRGIVARVMGEGFVVIWDNEDSDAHIDDSEADLIQRTIDVLNT